MQTASENLAATLAMALQLESLRLVSAVPL